MGPILAVAIDAPLRRLFDYRPPPGTPLEDLHPVCACGYLSAPPRGRCRSWRCAPPRTSPAKSCAPAIAKSAPSQFSIRRCSSCSMGGGVLPASARRGARRGAPQGRCARVRTPQYFATRWSLSVAARTGGLPPIMPRASRLRELADPDAVPDAGEAELAALSPRWRDHVRELERRGWVVRFRVDDPRRSQARRASRAAPPCTQPNTTPWRRSAARTDDSHSSCCMASPAAARPRSTCGRSRACVARGRQALVLVPGDRADAAARRALRGALRGAARRAALRAHGRGAAAGLARARAAARRRS